jgi:hypothetical protein
LESNKEIRMPTTFFKKLSRLYIFLIYACLSGLILIGCAAKNLNHTSIDPAQVREEKIGKVAVLLFESPLMDMQAGLHISRLFELNLLNSGLYEIVDRGEVEKILGEKGGYMSPGISSLRLRQLGDLLQVDGVILGSVSQYGRLDLAFTARLVSVKSGRVVWSISQTGGGMFTPISEVADNTVRSAVMDLKATLGSGK